MVRQVEFNLPGKIHGILTRIGKVLEISLVGASGSFHAAQAWKVRFETPGPILLIKRRPCTPLALIQCELAFSLLDSGPFRDVAWVPKPVPQFGPFQELDGNLFQAWSWMPGVPPGGAPFPLGTALDRLGQFHQMSRRIIGETRGAIPGVEARLEIFEREINGESPCDPVGLKAKELVDLWTPIGKNFLRSVLGSASLTVCHGDSWIGNWLVGGDFGNEVLAETEFHPALIDWSNVRWDHPAVDRARLIGSTGEVIRPGTKGGFTDSLETLLAWTGHVAALRKWLSRFEKMPWRPFERTRVIWLLSRLGETPG